MTWIVDAARSALGLNTPETRALPLPPEDEGPAFEPPGVLIRELRLAVVCYGGVSLATYMHGTVKELYKLARASHRFAEYGDTRNPYHSEPSCDSEAFYWELCRDISAALSQPGETVRVRVVIDVIAGSSAGGINGVLLAKSLAEGVSQEGLRQVWLERASVWKLLPHRGGILGGRKYTDWIVEALVDMEQRPEPDVGRIMPHGHRLDLFVTLTDVAGRIARLPIADPPWVIDRDHRHVLHFESPTASGVDQLASDYMPLLAFAARATSSFPGAMEPAQLQDVDRALERLGRPWERQTRERMIHELFGAYFEEPGQHPDRQFFVDGGVLNNKPFDLALAAIAHKPADHEVDRRLVYIEPEPLPPPDTSREHKISWLSAAYRATLVIPLHQPIVDTVGQIDRYNRTVDLIAGIVQRHRADVLDWIEGQVLGNRLDSSQATPQQLELWRRLAQERTSGVLGPQHAIYVEVKLRSVLGYISRIVCRRLGYPERGRRARFVELVWLSWGQITGLLSVSLTSGQVSPERVRFLKDLDIEFRLRRLRFLVMGVNELYHPDPALGERPTRRALDRVKQPLYRLARDYTGLLLEERPELSGGALEDPLKRAIERVFAPEAIDGETDAKAYAARNLAAIGALRERLAARVARRRRELGERQDQVMASLPGLGWPLDAQRRLMARYLGFALWDALILPLLETAGLQEMHRIDVMRISSDDANPDLTWPRGRKLKGGRLGQFAGFLKRSYRENDYLWGRLDGADRIMSLLRSVTDPAGVTQRIPYAGVRQRLLYRIVQAEEGALTRSDDLIASLKEQLSRRQPDVAAARPGPIPVSAERVEPLVRPEPQTTEPGPLSRPNVTPAPVGLAPADQPPAG